MRRRLRPEPLESRRLLAATTYVNDAWVLVSDPDANGLDAGDTVSTTEDAGDVTYTFGTDAFTSIDDAIAAVDAGGTVKVFAGDYAGNVTVNKSVTLEGANAGVSAGVDAGTRGPESTIDGVVVIDADDVAVDGFTILGGAVAGESGEVGVFLAGGASGATIENNHITGDGDGRGILSTFNGENDNLTIRDNDIGGWTSGVFNQTNENVEVLGNVIHDNVAGVANDFTTNVSIRGNDFNANDEAVGTFESVDLTVALNNLDGNTLGVANYGGDPVDAAFNYWGTTDPNEIAKLIDGDVDFTPFLPAETNGTDTLIFEGDDTTLIVNTLTGDFTFTDADGNVYAGDGARVQNGKLKIHEHVGTTKLDIKGDVDGSIEVVVKPQGKARKQSFSLTVQDVEEPEPVA
jgi:hypothetical protein